MKIFLAFIRNTVIVSPKPLLSMSTLRNIMSVKRFLKKILCILTYNHPITYALFLTIFSIPVIQNSYCQEKNKMAKTTETVQQKDTPISFTPVLDKNGNIYIASYDGKLSAIDHNGNTKWYIQLADKINNGVIISSNDILYFSSEKTLYAMGLNGALKWIFNAENTIDLPPVIDNHGNIYIVTKKDDYLYTISPNGSMHWKVHINGGISSPPSVTADDSIYITTQDNILYAINTDGSLRWRRKIFSKQEEPFSMTKTANNISPNPPPQSKIMPINEAKEQNTAQLISVSAVTPEETQFFSKETNKLTTTSFEASIQNGTAPLTVKFSDTSTGKIIYRLWDFGDGSLTSSEEYPVHTYSKPGNYNIRLIIKRTDCTSTIIKQCYIIVTNTSSSNSMEITPGLSGENDEATPISVSISKKHNDTELYDSKSLLSIANSKN